nr:phosphoenolpyruvate hydrolase family protein [Natrinema hispanicum]
MGEISIRYYRTITHEKSLKRLHETVSSGDPIIGAGAGTGMSAKFAERGGVDLLTLLDRSQRDVARENRPVSGGDGRV